MAETYRHIFFDKGVIRNLNGTEIVKYTGNLYTGARKMRDFLKLYDGGKDLYIVCESCAAKKYREFVKVKE